LTNGRHFVTVPSVVHTSDKRPGDQMEAEMRQQPHVLAALEARREELAGVLRSVLPDPLHGIVLVARGSSDHAAILGRYLLEPACGRPVGLGAPSLQTLYHAPVDYSGFLVVAVSQSGATPEIATVVERVRAAGGRTLAVTNAAGSPLAEAADAAVELGAGEERAVPATKTFTAQALAFVLLAQALGAPADGGSGEAVQAVLDDPEPAERAAEAIGDATALIAVGRGAGFPMALEVALKLKEAALLPAEGYSAADLRHGPTALVSAGFPVLALNVGGPGAEDVSELERSLRESGAALHEIAPGAALGIPAGLPEPVAALAAVVRGQQVALALARRRGLDPDAPRGLSKVTATH
jgi:glucosamine--fructose-6-phosphate aminotransferase (isomerizing)